MKTFLEDLLEKIRSTQSKGAEVMEALYEIREAVQRVRTTEDEIGELETNLSKIQAANDRWREKSMCARGGGMYVFTDKIKPRKFEDEEKPE